jgi:hypothetical protein
MRAVLNRSTGTQLRREAQRHSPEGTPPRALLAALVPAKAREIALISLAFIPFPSARNVERFRSVRRWPPVRPRQRLRLCH